MGQAAGAAGAGLEDPRCALGRAALRDGVVVHLGVLEVHDLAPPASALVVLARAFSFSQNPHVQRGPFHIQLQCILLALVRSTVFG